MSTLRSIAIALSVIVITACQTLSPQAKPSKIGEQRQSWKVDRAETRAPQPDDCVLSSSAKTYSTGAGTDQVRVQISEGGIVSLVTEQDPFDERALAQMGMRVDDQDAVLKPNLARSRQLMFSPLQSAQLLEQMRTGNSLRIQIVLFPRQELLTGVYPLRGFENALLTYRMCEVMSAEQNPKD